MQEVYVFSPEAIFVPGNIVPYYLPGVKIQVFHGYAGEKKGHWVIRHYFDTYFTQGPHFTKGFQTLAEKYGTFEVLETGWSRQDWVKAHWRDFDAEKKALLNKYGRKQIVLYAPTFSPKLTSLLFMKEALVELVRKRDVLAIIKQHPFTRSEWVEEYRELAVNHEHILFMDDFSVAKYQLMADVMISDTSSVIYEFLLKDKPVITYRASNKDIRWKALPMFHSSVLPSIRCRLMKKASVNANGWWQTMIPIWTVRWPTVCSKVLATISVAMVYPTNARSTCGGNTLASKLLVG